MGTPPLPKARRKPEQIVTDLRKLTDDDLATLKAMQATLKEIDTINTTCTPVILPISSYTGEPYDPEWGYQVYPPGEPIKVHIHNMMLAIGQWLITLARNIAAFMIREDDDLDSIRSYSPYLRGYQPIDTPPPQLPPQGGSVLAPVAQNRPILSMSDSFQALAHSMYLLASAGKVSMVAKHEEMDPYIPPIPLPTYDIVMSDDYVVSRDEDESQKVIPHIVPLPKPDPRLVSIIST